MKKILLLIVISGFAASLRAQTPEDSAPITERVYLSTDKDNYLSGEIVWIKLMTTDGLGTPRSFSRVGYVELVDESGSRGRERIELRDGIGEGTMVLPPTLPTGWYRLVGYTRWMRNEGPEVFFEKRIGIVNPVSAEVPRGSLSNDPLPETVPVVSGSLRISADRSVYSPRSEVRIDIGAIPADIHTMSVSVTAADALGGFPRPAVGGWKELLAAGGSSGDFSGEYEAEYEGPVITGRLIPPASGATVPASSLLPLISFPGNDINLFGGSLDQQSDRVVFRTARIAGFDEAVTTLRGSGSAAYHIDLDDPYTGEPLASPLPTFPLERIDREAVLGQSLSMQLQYSYVNDFLTRESRPAPALFATPDYSYQMSEWRRFATMQEVITEFIFLVQFTRDSSGKRHLWVINEDFGSTRTNSLVLLDGIPVFDHDIIYNYNPLIIDRIDVYNDRYIFGNNVFYGIVAFYTAQNRYPELTPDPFTQIVPYDPGQARRLFYSPDHSAGEARPGRIPDYRHTLYWDADVAVGGDGHAGITFSTSDLTGTYQVVVEGVTSSGEPLSAVHRIEVR